ncbi:type II toxin-antitoxin system HicB family antitoxin [uncultured Thiocystis sp.]|jgi:predicted RNase H-like HicB family nuclease|uniref:type II toxin-antitoxin system HicB family antitoxin n=1 Tax=uncultured Thiocystis sp. TaxID=1202134 RepID=UPI00260091D2|nr:type II toxin-antitoxin system HicB family antitoxin [uncultured Thiocystis sp.]
MAAKCPTDRASLRIFKGFPAMLAPMGEYPVPPGKKNIAPSSPECRKQFEPGAFSYNRGFLMKGEFTAIIEAAPEGGFWAICPEIPGANGQGETLEETKESLRQAIEMILEDRTSDILRGLPQDAIRDTVAIR